ncbi:hypothetical protein HMP09_0052 [Sphingomonas sp. HMP9]|uniref:hypothetical protein n=1 Tax=Sphingomonas sp. HMP9 TaxID=1517554 RepID=UPI001596908E|nr:hypothetical protein [Sphingomonas sp. HMP9]BCA60818.1 hypothetical protein HMP09_0052 [Sphingomonas sp. HMP9]
MKGVAYEQACVSLRKCQVSADRLKLSSSFEQTCDAWADFLLATSRIYSKLEQGANGDTRSKSWFDLIKNERKKDPLLRYLHFARNADEHGLKPTATNSGKRIDFVSKDDNSLVGRAFVLAGGATFHRLSVSENGSPPVAYTKTVEHKFALVSVAHNERHGDYCAPPETHQGQAILFKTPDNIANIAMPYLTGMLAGAEYLLSSTNGNS